MQNILDPHPSYRARAKPPILNAAQELLDKAEQVARGVGYRWPIQPTDAEFEKSVQREFDRKNPSSSVNDGLKDAIDYWADRARTCTYDLADNGVMKKFTNFMAEVLTTGFSGQDTTGTQIGNRTEQKMVNTGTQRQRQG
jgi:hypothetical protein